MTERAKCPTAATYRELAERAARDAAILEADHGLSHPGAVAGRQFAAYYRRRAIQAERAAGIAAARARLTLCPADRAVLARRVLGEEADSTATRAARPTLTLVPDPASASPGESESAGGASVAGRHE